MSVQDADAYMEQTKRLPAPAPSTESMTEDVDESAGREAAPDPDVDAIPSLTTLAPAYDRLLEIATQRLDGPVQTRVRPGKTATSRFACITGTGRIRSGQTRAITTSCDTIAATTRLWRH